MGKAPERVLDQAWQRVRAALNKTVGGQHVRIKVEEYDQYDRVLGTVICNDRDVGEWLVSNGHAVAAYGDRYKQVETEARRERRGMWGSSHGSRHSCPCALSPRA